MLTKNKIKFIKSLESKKHRIKNNCFVVEGEKMVIELLESNFATKELFCTPEFYSRIKQITKINPIEVSESELKKISFLKTPNQALAIVDLPKVESSNNFTGLNLVLDNIQDPGNLGTIIRTANWFGVDRIYCSMETADAFAPKVVQATMGAIFRTKLIYCDLPITINNAKHSGLGIYGTLLNGDNIYHTKLNQNALIILGNESKGISAPIEKLIDYKIKIPNYTTGSQFMESLNVGIANAIVLAEFKRQS
ncbi:MAG: RNA methyltransferase [Salinivirgaceae bacterium]|jgi:TrmH family RNA methyltransferase|nr:RNA methyltransferase [Salinivirgaceae bacterium]